MAYGDIGMTEAEKQHLEAKCAKQGKRIADLCPVCLTWSWSPCDEGDEGAQLRVEKWVLCQCCNDSRIAVLWKRRAETAEAKLAEILPILEQAQEQISEEDDVAIAMEIERDKLREACETLMVALKKYPEAATPGMPLHGERTRGIESAYKAIKAALAKGDKKC